MSEYEQRIHAQQLERRHQEIESLMDAKVRLERECARLKGALAVVTDWTIYPATVSGTETDYAQRTEYMEGWNDCAKDAQQRLVEYFKNNLAPRGF